MRTYRKAIIGFIFIGMVSVHGCKVLQDYARKNAPEVSLLKVKVNSVDLEGINLDFTYQLKNKINIGLTLSRLKFKLLIDGNNFFNGDNKKNIELAAKATTNFTITHRIIYTQFAQSLIDLFKKDSIKVRLEGVVGVFFKTLNQSINVPFDGEKVIPLPKLPKISFGSFKYKSASLNPFNPKAKFELTFNVKNNNSFAIDITNLNYDFTAAGRKLVNGDSGRVAMKSGESKQLKIPVNLRGRDIIKLVPKLRDLNATSYKFNTQLKLKVGSQDISIPFSYP